MKLMRWALLKIYFVPSGRRMLRSYFRFKRSKWGRRAKQLAQVVDRFLLCVLIPLVALIALAAVVLIVCILVDWPSRPVHPAPAGQQSEAGPQLSVGRVCDATSCRDAALFTGQIQKDTADTVRQFLAMRPAIKTLCLRSPGGNNFSSLQLSKWLSISGYDTCLPQVDGNRAACASACTVAFMAGKRRTVSSDVVFGIHGASAYGLIGEAPDGLTGKPGSPRGTCWACQQTSIWGNFVLSWGSRVIARFFDFDNPALTRLLEMSWPIPGHTLRLLSVAELQSLGFTTEEIPTSLVWTETQEILPLNTQTNPLSR